MSSKSKQPRPDLVCARCGGDINYVTRIYIQRIVLPTCELGEQHIESDDALICERCGDIAEDPHSALEDGLIVFKETP